MEKQTVETIIRLFNEADVRYLIAGGFAVIAHGYTRLTMDLDLVLDLSPDNALKALKIFKSEGYAPKSRFPSNNSRMRNCAMTGRPTATWWRFRCGASGIA